MMRAAALVIVATIPAGAALAAQQSGFTRTPRQTGYLVRALQPHRDQRLYQTRRISSRTAGT